MSVRTQGTRPGMSRSVIIRFRVNQKSWGKSSIDWSYFMVLIDLQFMTNNFMIQDDSDFYGFSLVCGVVTLMLIVCVLLVHWQIYNESINHLSLVAVWCRGLWSDVGDKTRRPRPHLGHSPWSPESESHHLTWSREWQSPYTRERESRAWKSP